MNDDNLTPMETLNSHSRALTGALLTGMVVAMLIGASLMLPGSSDRLFSLAFSGVLTGYLTAALGGAVVAAHLNTLMGAGQRSSARTTLITFLVLRLLMEAFFQLIYWSEAGQSRYEDATLFFILVWFPTLLQPFFLLGAFIGSRPTTTLEAPLPEGEAWG